ncbi:MAG: hypothetical protein CVU05_13625, partial [Bacteroidetes bacterium HGW-Bacteroidetes-21]
QVNTEIFRGEIVSYQPANGPDSPFSLYYPKDSCENYPLLVILDPHAAGKQVVEKYQQLADKYDVILAASDKVQNGMIPNQFLPLINSIINEVSSVLPVDTTKIYLLGFSGGARMAAVTAMSQDNIQGIITCGAGTPEIARITRNDFLYIGMAGYRDFNFSELFHSEKAINEQHKQAHFLYFDGAHEWPSDSTMEFAFALISSQKADKESLSDLVMSSFKKNYKPHDEWRKYLDYRAVQTLTQNVQGMKNEKEAMVQYLKGSKSQMALREIEKNFESEYASMQELQQSLTSKDSVWWRKKISKLWLAKDKVQKTSADYVDIRLLGYISISCYMYVTAALKEGDLNNAARFLDVYLLADPTNSEVSYYYGVYFARTGQYQAAIDSLSNALDRGFSDYARWNSEEAFIPLKDSLRYIDLESRMNAL